MNSSGYNPYSAQLVATRYPHGILATDVYQYKNWFVQMSTTLGRIATIIGVKADVVFSIVVLIITELGTYVSKLDQTVTEYNIDWNMGKWVELYGRVTIIK